MTPVPDTSPAANPAEDRFCGAISQHGKPVTLYIAGQPVFAIAGPGHDLVCTQDSGHGGSHAACDGHGHILARWPRSAVERYWQPGECKGHEHG
jgi:hypothetical protein